VGAAGPADYEYDGSGNVVGLSAADGSFHNRYVYALFGEQLVTEEAVANPFQFVGRFGVMREGNGLEFMRARFYSPVDGRFLSDDPLGLAAGDVNLRRYVGNTPINAIDPAGLQDEGAPDSGIPACPECLAPTKVYSPNPGEDMYDHVYGPPHAG